MKGMQGLIVAGLLGLLAVALNWIYLDGKTRDKSEYVKFLGVKSGASIAPGQVIRDDQLQAVPVPKDYAKNLEDTAYLYEERALVVGMTATAERKAGDLLYREDYRTPPVELKLQPGEMLIWIPVNSASFVPELVNPGDRINFIVPIYTNSPVPAAGDGSGPTALARHLVETKPIGPFRVGSLGSRLASREVARAHRLSSSQERLIGIVINKAETLEMDRLAELQKYVLSRDYRGDIGVALLGPEQPGAGLPAAVPPPVPPKEPPGTQPKV